MNKILAAVVASTIALGSASVFAAAAKQELTQEERVEMRNRADQLKARAATPAAVKAVDQTAPKTKKPHAKKSKKVSKHDAKKTPKV
jgi:hypothetical protein